MWNMDSLGLDKYGVALMKENNIEDVVVPVADKVLKEKAIHLELFLEAWEKPLLTKDDVESQEKLLTKYGGLLVSDGEELFTLKSDKMNFYKGRNCLIAVREGYEYDPDNPDPKSYENMEINHDLFGLLYTSIKGKRLKKVSYYVSPEDVDEAKEWKWKNNSPNKKQKKPKPIQKPTRQSPRKNKSKKK